MKMNVKRGLFEKDANQFSITRTVFDKKNAQLAIHNNSSHTVLAFIDQLVCGCLSLVAVGAAGCLGQLLLAVRKPHQLKPEGVYFFHGLHECAEAYRLADIAACLPLVGRKDIVIAV